MGHKASKRKEQEMDYTLELSTWEKELILKDWEEIENHPYGCCLLFFQLFLDAHPEFQELYPAFRSYPHPLLYKNIFFQRQAINVMYHLNDIVTNVNHSEDIVKKIRYLKLIHERKKAGVPNTGYKLMFEILLLFLENHLKFKKKKDNKVVWRKFLEKLSDIFCDPSKYENLHIVKIDIEYDPSEVKEMSS